MNGVTKAYETGSTKKTWYCKSSVEARKLRSESRDIAEVWRRMEEVQITAAMSVKQVNARKPKTGVHLTTTPRKLKERFVDWYAAYQSDAGAFTSHFVRLVALIS